MIALIASSAVAAACGGHRHPVRGQRDGALQRSPCRGVDPWKGDALRRCAALVARWAPVQSVRLTAKRSPRVRSTCERAAREVRIPVTCPPLVPADGVVADPNLYGAEGPRLPDTAGDFYLLTFNNGDNRGHLHWIVGAGRDRTVQRFLFDPRDWVAPGHVRRLGERRYGPWAIAFYRFPPHPSGGALGGHALALAQVGGTTYFASVHGWTHRDADAAMLIAVLLTAP